MGLRPLCSAAGRAQAVGSHVIMTGRMLGVDLSLEEVVRDREPPRRKEWETIGHPGFSS